MFYFLLLLIKLFLSLFHGSREIIIQNIILSKENEILKRRLKKRIRFKFVDKLFYSIFNKLSDKAKDYITLIKPETVLKWQKRLIKKFWTFVSDKPGIGRPPVSKEIKNLILKMKNKNLYWGYMRIQGELLKLGIELDKITIRNILFDFRRKGKVKKGLSWSKFLKSHIKSIYAMDFFTVDTIFNQRFYVLFIIKHETREIIQFVVTTNPVRELIKQQIIDLTEELNEVIYLIYDNARQFKLNYIDYGIRGILTSVKAPNMPLGARRVISIAERWIGSVRREILDHFIIFNESQLKNILKEYVKYYNKTRPHQGIYQQIPQGYKISKDGKIKSRPILFGLNQEYYRGAA